MDLSTIAGYLRAVESEQAAAVRAVYEQWGQGNFRAGREMLSDEVRFLIDYPHGPQEFNGPAGVAEYIREILSEWDDMRVEAEELVEVGDTVFVAQRQIQRGKGSGVATEARTAAVWTFDAGRVVRLQFFREPDEARVAAGVPK